MDGLDRIDPIVLLPFAATMRQAMNILYTAFGLLSIVFLFAVSLFPLAGFVGH